jgi:3-hydroxyacyl-CoA dehydrogenase
MSKAAVVGLGTMGPGIAQTLARAGMEVIAFDVSEDQRKKAGDGLTMAGNVLKALGVPEKGTIPVKIAGSLKECLDKATLVVETVPEKLEIKASVFRRSTRWSTRSASSPATRRASPSPSCRRMSPRRSAWSACTGRTRRTSSR